MIEQIKTILSKRKTKYQHLSFLFSRQNPELFRIISEKFSDTTNFSEKVYRCLYQMEVPPLCEVCQVNRVNKFKDFDTGYDKSCCRKCAAQHPARLTKIATTNIQRYGNICPLNDAKIRAKSQETLMNNYQVTNPGQLKKAGPKMKIKWFNSLSEERLGNCTPLFNVDQYLNTTSTTFSFECNQCNQKFDTYILNGHIPICPLCNPPESKSKMEEELILEIRQHYSGIINRSNRSVLKDLELDIYLPELDLAIELNGLYWHSTKFKKDRNYHLNKLLRCQELGIHLVQVFEDQWSSQREIVVSRILSLIGKTTKVYARKCQVEIIESKVAKQFLISNHIQGSVNTKLHYGLKYQGKLVSIMSFGKSRYDKNIQWELLRYCCLVNHTVVGGPSRLLAKFVEHYSPESIISYADRCWSSGNLYQQLGFTLARISVPSHSYVIRNQRLSRLQFQKHKLSTILSNFDPALTEWENMEANGFYQIYDCGNLVFLRQ